jgi:hypothetical protein
VAKFVARKDPVSGPFVALSPGLLSAARPEPIPDSEAPVDSSDFIDERKGASPKAPPVRRPVVPDKAPPKRAEAALPLKIKEPPKPPRQKPRPPTRSDDVADDLLSADVSFERAAPEAETPLLVAPALEAPRLLAPDASALAAQPAPEAPREAPKPIAESTASRSSDGSTSAPAPRKSSRVVPIVVLALGGAGAFALAFRSQLPGDSAPEKPAADSPASAAALAPTLPDPTPPLPPPIELPAAEPASSGATTPPTPSATSPSGGSTLAPRAAAQPSPATAATSSPSAAALTPRPAITAAAPGATEPSDTPRQPAEGPFNAEAARTALAGAVAQASSCRKPGDPSGVAAVTITFSPSGRVTSATIAGPPFAGTPTGGCIAATLRRARVPAFEGEMVTVRKTVEIQ